MNTLVEKLANASQENHSLLCVGLDADPELMPITDVAEFNRAIVDATKDLVCAYKPNLPFYEAMGIPGLKALEASISYIRSEAPNVLLIGDCKRGDIASTNVFYARALFEVWGFDAVTVNAYAGYESLKPFLDYEDHGIFVFCRSSNPGAKEFQDLQLVSESFTRVATHTDKDEIRETRVTDQFLSPYQDSKEPITLYEHIALRANEWNPSGNVGLVVGATYPQEVERLRQLCPGLPFLIPGVGAQGGGLEDAVKLGLDDGFHNVLISSSRGIIYSSTDKNDFADAARSAATDLRNAINRIIEQEGRGWS